MDLGVYKRSRVQLWLLMLGPLLLGVALNVAAAYRYQRALQRLAHYREARETLPVMFAQMDAARAAAGAFDPGFNSGDEALQRLKAIVDVAVSESGVTLESFTATEPEAARIGPSVTMLSARVTVQGSLPALAELFSRCYAPELLTSVESVELVGSGFHVSPMYSAEIEIKLGRVTP